MPSSWPVPLSERSCPEGLNDAARQSPPQSPPPEKGWNLQRGTEPPGRREASRGGIFRGRCGTSRGGLRNLLGRAARPPEEVRSLQGSTGTSRCWAAKRTITAAYSGRSRTRFQNQPLWSPRDGNRTRATWDFSNRGNRSGQFCLRERNQSDAFWNLRHPAAEMQTISGQSQNDFHQWGPRAGRLPTIRRFPATPKRSVPH